MKKLVLGTLVGMSLAFGAEVNEDLLSVATAGKVKGDKLALSTQEMSEVKGGSIYSSIYSSAFIKYYYYGAPSWSSLIRVNGQRLY